MECNLTLNFEEVFESVGFCKVSHAGLHVISLNFNKNTTGKNMHDICSYVRPSLYKNLSHNEQQLSLNPQRILFFSFGILFNRQPTTDLQGLKS